MRWSEAPYLVPSSPAPATTTETRSSTMPLLPARSQQPWSSSTALPSWGRATAFAVPLSYNKNKYLFSGVMSSSINHHLQSSLLTAVLPCEYSEQPFSLALRFGCSRQFVAVILWWFGLSGEVSCSNWGQSRACKECFCTSGSSWEASVVKRVGFFFSG